MDKSVIRESIETALYALYYQSIEAENQMKEVEKIGSPNLKDTFEFWKEISHRNGKAVKHLKDMQVRLVANDCICGGQQKGSGSHE